MAMKRREFLTSTAALLAVPLTANVARAAPHLDTLLHPTALKPGDAVGLITTGTPADETRIAHAEQQLRALGLRMKLGRTALKKSTQTDYSIQAKLDDLHCMFEDPEVRAVIPVRGGYGTVELLGGVDYQLIRRHPKVFLGFSDITPLHLAIQRKSRLVTFHGPNASYYPSEYSTSYLRKAIFGLQPIGRIDNPPSPADASFPGYPLRTIRGGIATGRLIGGNLTSISYTMGTPYEIETRDRIVFLEADAVEPYHVRRMLNQLLLAGKFDVAAGVVFGVCFNCAVPAGKVPYENTSYSADEAIAYMLGKLNVPVIAGLAIGHSPDQVTLPLGVRAVLDADARTLTVAESGVRA